MTAETSPPTAAATDRWLLGAAAAFALAVVLHNGDHLRREADSVSIDVFWLGTAGIVLEVAIVALICQRHRVAPLASLVSGASLAAGYLLVHFTPQRSWLSDSFPSGTDVSPLSWTAASIEVVAAVSLTFVGWAALRARGGLESAARPRPQQRSAASGLLHPLAAAFALSQVVTVAISFAQL